jgi:hypothetical protein
MDKIYSRSATTPFDAVYVSVRGRSGADRRVLTVEYYNSAKMKVPHASIVATVISEESHQKMIKAPAEPKAGKAATDPRRKDQDKRKDLPLGREVPDWEKEAMKLHTDEEPTDAENDFDKKPEIQTKHGSRPNGTSLGGKVEKPGGSFAKAKGAMKEGIGDETTYTWDSIQAAMYEIGLQSTDVTNMLGALHGKEQIDGAAGGIGEHKSTYSKLRSRIKEAQGDDFVYDPDGAQDDFQSELEGGPETKKKALVTIGMDDSEVAEKLVNLSKSYAEDIENLERSTKIRVIRFANQKVSEILPATLRKVYRGDNGQYIAVVKITNKQVKLPLGDQIINLKQAENGNFYFLDRQEDETNRPLKVNYN